MRPAARAPAIQEIRTGLRRLEFGAARDQSRTRSRVVVEFARAAPFAADELAHVVLGLREGLLRELLGRPKLLGRTIGVDGRCEYLYRLEGLLD